MALINSTTDTSQAHQSLGNFGAQQVLLFFFYNHGILACQPSNIITFQDPAKPVEIAFYAPLKSPNHIRPSGDRRLAQLFMQALQLGGWQVQLASEWRTWQPHSNPEKQAAMQAHAEQLAAQLVANYRRQEIAKRPQCWFTYHVYHKAPDYLGTAVSRALQIPYVIAEASLANKQRHGTWSHGYAHTLAAIQQAALIFNLNSNDKPAVQAVLHNPNTLVELKPFCPKVARPALAKPQLRAALAARYGLDTQRHWLLCVAMMRTTSKLQSYQMLAETTAALQRHDWQLLVVGDGDAAAQVRDLFRTQDATHIHWFGQRDANFIHQLMHASDLFVWPAHNEAFGMAVLEALSCGLPVLAGHSGGIGDIVQHEVTGRLVAQPDAHRLAAQIENLLAHPAELQRMATASLSAFDQFHRIERAGATINSALANLLS